MGLKNNLLSIVCAWLYIYTVELCLGIYKYLSTHCVSGTVEDISD